MSRADKLTAWLEEHQSRLMWQQPVRNVGVLSCYAVGDGIAMVMEYEGLGEAHNGGWDLFVPASLDSAIDATLAGATRALGMEERDRKTG